jgi:hypothetical protein
MIGLGLFGVVVFLILALAVAAYAHRYGFAFHRWNTPLGRRGYAVACFFIFATGFNLLRSSVGSRDFDWWIRPITAARVAQWKTEPAYLVLLCALAVLCAYFFVHYSVRRLDDAGLPLATAFLTLIPAVNVIFAAILCILPRSRLSDEELLNPGKPSAWFPRSGLGSAIMAAVVVAIFGVAATYLSTAVFRQYGWTLFVGLPFAMGFLSVYLYGLNGPHSFWRCVGVGMGSVGILGLMLVALAIEGLICVALAAPLALALCIPGAILGYYVKHRGRRADVPQLVGCLALILPLTMAAENRLHTVALATVTTTIVVQAPPQKIWPLLMKLDGLGQPQEFLFQNGAAYPIGTSSNGSGVGASRDCKLSSGAMSERVDVWEVNKRLRFQVLEQPLLLKEMSPYDIKPPHVAEHYLRSMTGEFRLIPLADGSTRIEGTTWYENKLWPNFYWEIFSDDVVHSVHARVLNEIRKQAEK